MTMSTILRFSKRTNNIVRWLRLTIKILSFKFSKNKLKNSMINEECRCYVKANVISVFFRKSSNKDSMGISKNKPLERRI